VPAPFSAAVHAWQVALHALLQHTPSAQEPETQPDPAAHGAPSCPWHTPVALHVYIPVHVSGSVAFVTVAQMPAVAPLHVWHTPQLADVQQTPSTQWPVSHCALVEHGPP